MSPTREIVEFCEGEALSSIGLPASPNIHFSKKLADSETGLAFTRALFDAAYAEWTA